MAENICDLAVFVGQEEGVVVSHFRRLPQVASRSEDGIGWGRPT